jgi:hypothetical protein
MFTVDIDATELESVYLSIKSSMRLTNKALEASAKEAVKDIKQRISEGKDSAGHFMVTKSRRRRGRYSMRHGLRREKKGKVIDIVNLKFTGQTLRSFVHLKTHRSFNGSWAESEIGFTNSTAAEKALKNDEQFGYAYAVRVSEVDKAFENYLKAFPSPLFDNII